MGPQTTEEWVFGNGNLPFPNSCTEKTPQKQFGGLYESRKQFPGFKELSENGNLNLWGRRPESTKLYRRRVYSGQRSTISEGHEGQESVFPAKGERNYITQESRWGSQMVHTIG